ncbi:hypothetical protein Sfulv_58260 [Streptomyces fulvorobeus]|uniref:Uncharacterized protein n=1 Tax=Streptomyces fulvorobeus TaxID=284028 RepID=A0A7J0CEX3_9ACTN|nr:hypothetical protein Sfulv_58260 [Streptomyces fulvorobeus]
MELFLDHHVGDDSLRAGVAEAEIHLTDDLADVHEEQTLRLAAVLNRRLHQLDLAVGEQAAMPGSFAVSAQPVATPGAVVRDGFCMVRLTKRRTPEWVRHGLCVASLHVWRLPRLRRPMHPADAGGGTGRRASPA